MSLVSCTQRVTVAKLYVDGDLVAETDKFFFAFYVNEVSAACGGSTRRGLSSSSPSPSPSPSPCDTCVLLPAGPSYTRKQGECLTAANGQDSDGISQADCKAKCDANKDCSAYEYTPSTSNCEIHHLRTQIITQADGALSASCFIKGMTHASNARASPQPPPII